MKKVLIALLLGLFVSAALPLRADDGAMAAPAAAPAPEHHAEKHHRVKHHAMKHHMVKRHVKKHHVVKHHAMKRHEKKHEEKHEDAAPAAEGAK